MSRSVIRQLRDEVVVLYNGLFATCLPVVNEVYG